MACISCTKLLGPAKWTYYYLYVILDVFSRYVVGWLAAYREAAVLAERLIAAACERQGIQPGQLTIHADRGSSMASKPVALLLADLGIIKTHSRPHVHVSNDNPYSEAQFKTLKYRPAFPERFGSLEHARAVSGELFQWYNHQHHHAALGLLTPADVHCGRAAAKTAARARVLAAAYARHPERFPRGLPQPPEVPTAVWINQPPSGPRALSTGNPPPDDARGCPRIDDERAADIFPAHKFAAVNASSEDILLAMRELLEKPGQSDEVQQLQRRLWGCDLASTQPRLSAHRRSAT